VSVSSIEWTEVLCTNSPKRKSAAQEISITALDRAQNGRWTYSAAGKSIPQSLGMVCRKRELDVVALFRGSSGRSDGEVEPELPTSRAADREQPRDESRLAVERRARPGLADGQNFVVHARNSRDRAGEAVA